MKCMFPTKHPSSFGFLLQGGSEYFSNEVFSVFCREGKEEMSWRPSAHGESLASKQQRGRGHIHLPTRHSHFRWQQRLKDEQWHCGRDVTCPPAEVNPHCPAAFWSAWQIPGGRAGGRNCPTWNCDRDRGKCLWKVQRRWGNKLLLDAGDGAVLFLFFKCGHG